MSRITRATAFLIGGGLILSLLLAAVASYYASSAPDGLERVAADHGFADTATDSATAASPFAEYAVSWLHEGRLSAGLAGAAGVLITMAAAFLLFPRLVRGQRRSGPGQRLDGGPDAVGG